MFYQGYLNGLYLLKQKSKEKGVDHYGILDIGNRIKHPNVDGINPVVVHQIPPNIKIDWLQNTGSWEMLGQIIDENMAVNRMREALKNPVYDLFSNNCEHFARFVATGKKESIQIQSAVIIAGLVALSIYALREA